MKHAGRMTQLTQELLRFAPPALAHERLADILKDEYGLAGRFRALAGERDQNIRVSPDGGPDYLLKVASPNEDPDLIDFQIRALDHLAVADPDLPVPRNVPTRSGAAGVSIPDPDGGAPFHLRLLTFVAGEPMSRVADVGATLVADTGDLMGRVNLALQGFEHPASTHFMPWNILNGLITNPQLVQDCLPDALRADCKRALARMARDSFPAMAARPAAVIHNDAHMGNLLIDPETHGHVVGLIDFGDMVRGPLVQDVGSTLSSFAETGGDLVTLSAHYIRALSRHVPFADAEVALVFDAMLARLILTVQLLRFRMSGEGATTAGIAAIDVPRAVDTLNVVLAHDRARFTRELRDALGR